jgi:plastocyanin
MHPNRTPQRSVLVVLTALAALSVACGDDGDAATVEVPDDADLVIVSEDLAFEPTEAEVPAGEPVVIVDENRDSVAHNVHLTDAPGSPKTPLQGGPSVQAMEVTLEPGEYTYVCDLHPNMRGTLRAV